MTPRLRERSGRPIDARVAADAMRGIQALEALPEGSLLRLARSARLFEVGPGIDVITQGRFPSGFFVVLDGALDVFAGDVHGQAPTKVNRLGAGAHLGEIGLIEGMPSTATVRTAEPSRLLRISGGEFLAAIGDSPAVISQLLGVMTGSMARTDPRYRFAFDEGAGSSHDRGLRALKTIASLASDVGPILRPFRHDDVLDRVAEATRLLFGAAACSIALIEEDLLVFRAAAGEGAEEIRGMELPPDRGIAGSVFRSGEPVVVTDVAADSRFDSAFAGSTGYTPTMLHAVRLETRLGPLGVMQVLDGERIGGEDGVKLLQVFAEQVALVIETERAFDSFGAALFAAAARLEEAGDEVAEVFLQVAREQGGPAGEVAAVAGLMKRVSELPEPRRRELLERWMSELEG